MFLCYSLKGKRKKRKKKWRRRKKKKEKRKQIRRFPKICHIFPRSITVLTEE